MLKYEDVAPDDTAYNVFFVEGSEGSEVVRQIAILKGHQITGVAFNIAYKENFRFTVVDEGGKMDRAKVVSLAEGLHYLFGGPYTPRREGQWEEQAEYLLRCMENT